MRGERRDVSILFADLTNYTGLSTELDAEDLHAIVRTYTQRVTAAVHAFGGTVERYIGDSVMAVLAHRWPTGTMPCVPYARL